MIQVFASPDGQQARRLRERIAAAVPNVPVLAIDETEPSALPDHVG